MASISTKKIQTCKSSNSNSPTTRNKRDPAASFSKWSFKCIDYNLIPSCPWVSPCTSCHWLRDAEWVKLCESLIPMVGLFFFLIYIPLKWGGVRFLQQVGPRRPSFHCNNLKLLKPFHLFELFQTWKWGGPQRVPISRKVNQAGTFPICTSLTGSVYGLQGSTSAVCKHYSSWCNTPPIYISLIFNSTHPNNVVSWLAAGFAIVVRILHMIQHPWLVVYVVWVS